MYHEYTLDYNYRQVRTDAPIASPCGCIGEDQRCAFLEFPTDEGPGFIECLGCGATWEQYEGHAWEDFDDN